ncbi:MAG: hypothetical protein HRT45_04265 [Bdellovibrionales bacterium]|nr:hypothetical protein [Bdellovibrionales bacterium]
MKVRSLGRRTDFIFAGFSGLIEDKGGYTLIKTPSNPGYHWGNYMVFDRAPEQGDLNRWRSLFDQEFSFYTEPHHYVFTWDTEANHPGEHQEFLEAGFELDSAVVLTAKELKKPAHYNDEIEFKKLSLTRSGSR